MRAAVPFILAILAVPGMQDDAGPGLTHREHWALGVEGFLIAQQLQAARCDAFLREAGLSNTPPQLDLHFAIVKRNRHRIAEAKRILHAYFQRTYGDRWSEALAERQREVLLEIDRAATANEARCREHAVKLVRRLDSGRGGN
jgi:hypothetical protein